jgi:hypothetical protein
MTRMNQTLRHIRRSRVTKLLETGLRCIPSPVAIRDRIERNRDILVQAALLLTWHSDSADDDVAADAHFNQHIKLDQNEPDSPPHSPIASHEATGDGITVHSKSRGDTCSHMADLKRCKSSRTTNFAANTNQVSI